MTSITENISGKQEDKFYRYIPLALITFFFCFTFLPRIQQDENLTYIFWSISAVLLVIYLLVLFGIFRNKIQPSIIIAIYPSHYVQAMVQFGVYSYWGWVVNKVYEQMPLIFAQIVFLYILGALISWTRGKAWKLGFGMFPIIFSTNLFLWFKDDVFFLQFAMITIGAFAKEFITWEKDGRRTHIFNPSAFGLSVASLFLILTHNTDISWGKAIAETITYPEHIYLWIFILGLVVQYLFKVTLVTLSAAMTLFISALIYFELTGVYFFITTDVPVAVFLGLHLLVTDPSTSPRTNLGRVMFGVLYGASVMVLFDLLGHFGAPTFYDKLLAIPLLNLSIQFLDRIARKIDLSILWPKAWQFALTGNRLNVMHMSIWIVFFMSVFFTHTLGSKHPGRNPMFWQKACDKKLFNACQDFYFLVAKECDKGHSLMCAKQAFMLKNSTGVARDDEKILEVVTRACDLGHEEMCVRLKRGEFDIKTN